MVNNKELLRKMDMKRAYAWNPEETVNLGGGITKQSLKNLTLVVFYTEIYRTTCYEVESSVVYISQIRIGPDSINI